MQNLIVEVDELLNKPSRKYAEADLDRLITLSNELFDLKVKNQEEFDVSKLKTDNEYDGEFILLKEELSEDGKKVHTDKTAASALNVKYEAKTILNLKQKHLFNTIDNKLKLMERKENIVKKVLFKG